MGFAFQQPFRQVTAQQLHSDFNLISNIVKSKNPVAITQQGKPTMVLFSYEEAMEISRLLSAKAFSQWLEQRTENPLSKDKITQDELNKLIDEERNAL